MTTGNEPNRIVWGDTFDDVTVTVLDSASLSDAARLYGCRLVGFATDSAWDTQAVTFQRSSDGSTYQNVYDQYNVEYSIPAVVASTYHAVDPAVFIGCRYIKVRSGTAGAAANQNGNTVVTLTCGLF